MNLPVNAPPLPMRPPTPVGCASLLPSDPGTLLQMVCNVMAEAVVVADATGKVVLMSAAARRLIGIAADAPPPEDWSAICGRYLADGVTPVTRDRLLVTRALAGELVDGEIFCFRRDDTAEPVWVDGSARPITTAEGEIQGCVLVWRDVSAQIVAERKLRRSEGRFQAIFNGISDAAVFTDIEGRIVLTNPAFCAMFGFNAEEVMGHAGALPHLGSGRDRAGQGVFEARYRRKDGSLFWCETLSTRIVGADGAPVGYLCLHRDIGARKAAESALRSQLDMQSWLAKVAATVPGVICSFRLRPDGTSCMPYASSGFEALCGLHPEEVREDAGALFARIHADDVAHVNATIAASAESMTPWRDEFRFDHPLKGEIWIEGHSMPEHEADGGILWHGYLQDISERKRMEAALSASERLYRAIGESIDFGVWVCAPDGRNLYASESFLSLVGLTQEQCSDFGWAEVLHPDDAARTIAAWQECVREGRFWDIEHRFRGVDGHWHDVLARGMPVRNEQGEIIYWAGINLDIGRLRWAEQALRVSEAELRRAQAVSRTGSWRLDVQRNDLHWSEENHRIFGVPRGVPLSYESFLAIVHPDDRAAVDRSWRNALRGEPYDVEHRIVVDGLVKWVRERVELEFDERGRLAGGFGTTQDITERKSAEAALAASESRYRLAMKAVAGVVYDWDRCSDRVEWSSGLMRIFGVNICDPLAGRRWWQESVHPEDLRRIRPAVLRGMKTRCDQLQLDYRMRHAEGHWLHVSDRAYLVRDASGRAIRMVGSLTDISARVAAEAELRRVNDTLEELVAERSFEAEARARALAESERFARSTIDALNSTLCVLDASGVIIAVNKAWREFACDNGGDTEKLGERADYLAVCDAAAPTCPTAARMARAIRAAMAGQRRSYSFEYECNSPQQRRWFVAKLSCFPGRGPLRLLVVHENVTERKLAAMAEIESARRLKRMTAHLESVREEQSATLAREVHDELGGTLTMLKLGLATTVDGLDGSAQMQERFRLMLEQVDSALQTVKRISAGLRPAMLDTLGLIATINWYAGEFSRLTGIASVPHMPEYVRLSPERSTAVFRIVQEALTNVAKHAAAKRVSIDMRKHRANLIVEVADDGVGLSADSLHKPDSFGLIGMHERAQYLGGQLSISRTPGAGTRLTLQMPLDERRAPKEPDGW